MNGPDHKLSSAHESGLENNSGVYDTIAFISNNKMFDRIREHLKNSELDGNLRHATLIDGSYEKPLQDFKGIELVNRILREEPNSKIILCSLLPRDFVMSRGDSIKDGFELFESYPNTRFLVLPFS